MSFTKLTRLEERFVTFLTAIVWWFEVRWNKGAVFVSFLFVFWIPALISFLLMVFTMDQIIGERTLLAFVILFLIIPAVTGFSISLLLIQLLMIAWNPGKINVLKNTKTNPNPNKINIWIWLCRLAALLSLVGLFTVPLGVIFIAPLLLPAVYVLCVDPIPPQEKEKRREKNKLAKLRVNLEPSCS